MNYYETLGISKDASASDIKKAFKKKAMKYHPDRNAGDKESEKKFKEVKEAFDVLSDPQKKSMYDQFGTTDFNSGGPSGSYGSQGFSGGFNDVFEDIFGDIFGNQRGSSNQTYKGADLEYSLSLTLEEAAFGCEKNINISIQDTCDHCGGTGAEPGSDLKTCPTCNGAGQVRMQQGFFSIQQTCPTCNGKGKIISNPCGVCRGSGVVNKKQSISVNIPAGVDSGDRIRVAGKGEAGLNGGPKGDLFIRVKTLNHEMFYRDGTNLHCEIPISFIQAALGSEIEVPSLSGNKLNIFIPAGTQNGKVFRLKGKGVKSVRSSQIGDLMCKIIVETPINLTSKQKTLLNQFDEELKKGGSKHSPKTQSWVDSIKNFFN